MPSDADLVERRSPKELRYLKDHVSKIRSDPRVVAATEVYENTAPIFTLEAFRTGILIDGIPCRMTIGTLALLRGTACRCLGYGERTDPLSDYDVAHGVFLLSDDDRNQAVSVSDDPDEFKKAVKKFGKRINLKLASVQLYEFLSRISMALGYDPDDKTEAPAPNIFQLADDAWADDVDLLASEHNETYYDLLWEIPLILVVRLKESIHARRTNRRRTSRREKSSIELLQKIEEVGKELKEKSA